MAFLVAAAVVCAGLLWLNQLPLWLLLSHADARPSANDWERAAGKLAKAVNSRSEIAILVGGSTARELTGKGAYVSGALSAACGRPLLFINAATAEQNIAETWSLVDTIPKHRNVLVVLAVNYYSFEHSSNETARGLSLNRFPFPPSQSLTDLFVGKAGIQPAAPHLLHQLAWLANHAHAFDWRGMTPSDSQSNNVGVGSPFEGSANAYREPRPLQDKKAIAEQYIAERSMGIDAINSESRTLWTAFVRHEHSQGIPVVVLAAPESSTFVPVDAVFGTRFRADLSALAAAGASTTDWRHVAYLKENDFYDQQHLLASGRARFFPRLLDLMRKAVPRCGQAGR